MFHVFIQSWFDWWDKKRNLIFPAYLHVRGGSKMNQAEAIHASWVKRDRTNLSLLEFRCGTGRRAG